MAPSKYVYCNRNGHLIYICSKTFISCKITEIYLVNKIVKEFLYTDEDNFICTIYHIPLLEQQLDLFDECGVQSACSWAGSQIVCYRFSSCVHSEECAESGSQPDSGGFNIRFEERTLERFFKPEDWLPYRKISNNFFNCWIGFELFPQVDILLLIELKSGK